MMIMAGRPLGLWLAGSQHILDGDWLEYPAGEGATYFTVIRYRERQLSELQPTNLLISTHYVYIHTWVLAISVTINTYYLDTFPTLMLVTFAKKVLWCFIHVCFVQVTILNIVWCFRRTDAPRCTHFSTDTCWVIQEGVKSIEKCAHWGVSARPERHILSLG